MLKKIIRHFKGDDLQYPFYNILGRGCMLFILVQAVIIYLLALFVNVLLLRIVV